MPKPTKRLKRADIIRALVRLGELCSARKSKVEVAIYGGTVMMFAYNCRAATKDIDAIYEPVEAVEPLIEQVGRELRLPADWLNNGVKSFVATQEAKAAFPELQIPGLMITRPTTEYLLAMKCMAGRLPTPFRAGDVADIKFLLGKLNVKSIQRVDRIVADFYGDRTLDPGKRWLIQELLKEVRDEKSLAS